MTDIEMISIPRTSYISLLESERILVALQSAGVDNWEGYADALSLLEDL